MTKDPIPLSIIQQPIESFINSSEQLPQLVFLKQIGQNFDAKESLLGFYGTT